MTLSDFLDAVVSDLKARFPKLDIKTHGGQFTASELKRFSVAAPAMRIAALSFNNGKNVGEGLVEYDVGFACIIITKDTRQMDRGTAASNLAMDAALAINFNSFGLDTAYPADHPRAKSLYSTDKDMQGVAFWTVEWTQRLQLSTRSADDCDVPTEIYIGTAPETGPDHIDDYEHLGGEHD